MVEPANGPVLILTGAPGAGKTTTARLLAADSERAVHLESDSFFRFIQSGYIEPWKPESHRQNTVVMRIVAGAAAGYADAGYFTIIDGIVLPGWFLEPLRDWLRDDGHPVAYAVVRPPLAVCVSRAAHGMAPGVPDAAVVERFWQGFSDLGSFERHAIDVDDESVREIASLIARRYRDGRLCT